MELRKIKNQTQLIERIRFLEAKKEIHEQLIVEHASAIYEVVSDPVPLLKETVHTLAGDKDFKGDLLKVGVNLAAAYVGNKFSAGSGAKSNIIGMVIDALSSEKGNVLFSKVKNWISEFISKTNKKEKNEK